MRHTTFGRARSTFLAAAIVLVVALSPMAAANADDTTPLGDSPFVSLIPAQVTGTAPFNDNDDAGFDSSADNDIVRTNDTVTYRAEVTTAAAAPGTILSLRLPKGEVLEAIPPFCGANSSLTPESIAAPGHDLTSTSWLDLPEQVVNCDLGDVPAASTQTFPFVAKVRPEIPNGTALSGHFVVTSGEHEVVSDELTHTVSAKGMYDISIGQALNPNEGRIYSDPKFCGTPGQACYSYTSSIHISAPTGGKGNSPMTGDVTYQIDLSPLATYGTGIESKPAWQNATAAERQAFRSYFSVLSTLNSCDITPIDTAFGPSSNYRADAPERSVTRSGTTVCDIDVNTGMMTFTVSGMNSTAWHVPTLNGRGGGTPPPDRAMIYTVGLRIAVPYTNVNLLGDTVDDAIYTLPYTLTVENLQGTALDGSPIDQAYDVDWNNYRYTSINTRPSGSWDAYPMGIPGQSDPEQTAANTDHHILYGYTGTHNGTGVVMEGQRAVWMLRSNAQRYDGVAFDAAFCVSFDNTAAALTDQNVPVGGKRWYAKPNDGKATWLSGDASVATGVTIRAQYAAGSYGAGEDTRCGATDAVGGWHDDPASVPGNDAALAATGVYTAPTKVRVVMTGLNADGTAYTASILNQFMYLGGLPIGSVIPFWATGTNATTGTLDTWADYEAVQGSWKASTFAPGETSGDSFTGGAGGRVITADVSVRIKKEVKNRAGEWTKATPAYTAGDTVEYRLSPAFTSPVPSMLPFTDLLVEDCLPAGVTYVPGSASVEPTSVSRSALTGTTIDCDPGETRVTWEFPEANVNELIEPIVFSVRIANTAANGVYRNDVSVYSSIDFSTPAQRADNASFSVDSPAGVRIAKTAVEPLIEINPAGGSNPEYASWIVDFVNLNSPTGVSNIDVLDVLPRSGHATTQMNGGLALDQVSVVEGDNITISYTTQAGVVPGTDPTTVAWQPVTAGADLSVATALRFERPGQFLPEDTLSVRIDMLPVANRGGNVYDNITIGRATGLLQPVGPTGDVVTVQSSSVGDYVWWDTNRNGIQDDGEPVAAGVPVALSGTNSRGDTITRNAVTDPNGRYTFADLVSGDYEVTFTAPSGSEFTIERAGASDQTNSKADASGRSGTFALAAGESNLNIDAGLVMDGSIVVNKTSDIPYNTLLSPGEEIEYTIEFSNPDARWDYDAIVTDDLSGITGALTIDENSITNGAVYSAANETITWTGTLAPGEVQSFTFTATMNADVPPTTLIRNVVRANGFIPPACEEGTEDGCWTQHRVGDPSIESSKVSTPASGTRVIPGTDIDYIVEATNTGNVPLNATVTDVLTDVLDDAAVDVSTATSSVPGDITLEGDRLVWRGALDVGQTVRIEFSATVNEDVSPDAIILNGHLASATDPAGNDVPNNCTEENAITEACATVHYPSIPGLNVVKRADIVDGEVVHPGGDINYTVEFANTGTDILTDAVMTDDLSGVLDYADFDEASLSADAGDVSYADETITWTGTLAPGEIVTITYTVTVNTRGDEVLVNVASGSGTTETGKRIDAQCEGTCSTNHTLSDPSYTIEKTSEPESASQVRSGDVIEYRIEIVNTGNAPVDVNAVDNYSKVVGAAVVPGSLTVMEGAAETAFDEAVSELHILATIPVGESVVVTFQMRVAPEVAQNAILRNIVTAEGFDENGVGLENACVTGDEDGCNVFHRTGLLAITGGEASVLIISLAGGLVAVGALMLIVSRRRRAA